MYYAEKVIDGVLHYKTTPRGQWIPYTQEELSQMVIELKKALDQALYI